VIDYAVVEYEVLISGSEDITGLYQVLWFLNASYPEAPVGDKYAVADQAIRTLISGDYIELYRCQPLEDGRPVERIDPAEADTLLRDPTAWYPEWSAEPGVQIAFMNTDAGDQEYSRRHPPA
jgi:hypothetical protein